MDPPKPTGVPPPAPVVLPAPTVPAATASVPATGTALRRLVKGLMKGPRQASGLSQQVTAQEQSSAAAADGARPASACPMLQPSAAADERQAGSGPHDASNSPPPPSQQQQQKQQAGEVLLPTAMVAEPEAAPVSLRAPPERKPQGMLLWPNPSPTQPTQPTPALAAEQDASRPQLQEPQEVEHERPAAAAQQAAGEEGGVQHVLAAEVAGQGGSQRPEPPAEQHAPAGQQQQQQQDGSPPRQDGSPLQQSSSEGSAAKMSNPASLLGSHEGGSEEAQATGSAADEAAAASSAPGGEPQAAAVASLMVTAQDTAPLLSSPAAPKAEAIEAAAVPAIKEEPGADVAAAATSAPPELPAAVENGKLIGVALGSDGRWDATMTLRLDRAGRLADGGRRVCRVEGLDSYQEAAVARDLLLLWRRSAAPASGLQLCGGGVTQSNCDLDRLEQAEGLMSRLRDCDTSDELLELVECMASSGELTTLADATLPPVEVPPDAAAQPPAATAATPPALLLVRAQPVASARTLSTAAARPALLGSELAPAELSPEDLAPPAPAAAAPTPSKFAGVLKRVGHKWAVMLRVAQDDSGRAKRGPRASVNLDVVFGSAAAAALARDLAMVWRQHCCNQEVEDIHAHERYNYAPSDLPESLVQRVLGMPTFLDLKLLLDELERAGELASAAAKLAPLPVVVKQEAADTAAAAGTPAAAAAVAAAEGAEGPAAVAGRRAIAGVRKLEGKWAASISIAMDGNGLVGAENSTRQQLHFGAMDSQEEALVVRDLMLAWRQLCTKADLAASPFEYTYSVNSLRHQEALLQRLGSCDTWLQLRMVLRTLTASGELSRLAAALPPAVPGEQVAAAGFTRFWGVSAAADKWSATLLAPFDKAGRLSDNAGRGQKSVGSYSSKEEAAVARDLALCWRQLGTGASIHSATEPFNVCPDSLLSHGGLKQQLHDCSSIDALRVLLKSLAAAGELPRPAALSQALPAGSQPTSVAAAAAPAAITAPTAAAPAVLVPMTTAAAAGGEAAPASAAPSEEAAPPALQAVEAEGGMQSFSGVLVSANSSFKARLKLPVDSADRLSASAASALKQVGCFRSRLAAVAARDLAMSWRQLGLGQRLDEAKERYHLPLDSLEREAALLSQLQACTRLTKLRALLQKLETEGELARLAASLAPPGALAAARQGSKKRPRAAAAAGREGEAAVKEEPQHAQLQQQEQQRPAKRARPTQQAARGGRHGAGKELVGQRIDVWLEPNGTLALYTGTVAEYIPRPSGKHHILFDDGEEGLVDLRRVHWQLTDTPQPAVAAAHWHSTAAESPVGTVADVGQHVQVWWQEEGSWFDATIFAITKGGSRLPCARYADDGSEALLGLDEKPVRWVGSAERQRQHDRAARDYRHRHRTTRDARQEGTQVALGGAPAKQEGGQAAAAMVKAEVEEEEEEDAEAAALQRKCRRKQQPLVAAQEGTKRQRLTPPPPARSPGCGSAAALPKSGAGAAGAGSAAPPPGAAAAQKEEVEICAALLEAADSPAAAASGLSEDLAARYAMLHDELPEEEQSKKEGRLRKLLADQKYGLVATMITTALKLKGLL